MEDTARLLFWVAQEFIFYFFKKIFFCQILVNPDKKHKKLVFCLEIYLLSLI